MSERAKLRGAPMFVRLFGWMMAGVAAVQVLNALLFTLVPPPQPRAYTIAQISAVLRAGRDPAGALRVTAAAPDAAPMGSFERKLRGRLAEALGVPAERVAVAFRHGPPGPMPGREPPGPMPMAPGMGPPPAPQWLLGDFAASVRLPDGGWRTVQPVRSDSLSFWWWRTLLGLLAAVVAMAPIAWLLARRVTRPIALFARAAERLGRDPRAPPIEVEGPHEIAEAAAAFNEMQARLTRYVEDRSLMTAAIAHDLRTPLMRLSLRLETAPEPVRAAAERDIRDMQGMIDAVLAFLRDLHSPMRRERLDLRSAIESVVDGYADRGDAATLRDGEDVTLEADPRAIKAMVANLVGNALAYAGDAEVSLGTGAGEVWIEVADHGLGVPEDMLERVFQPFFRLEQSRNRATGGTGLGLANVRAIARAHGGDVVLANRAGGGLLARVTLPG